MPEDHSIIKSVTGPKITQELQEAHEKALETEVSVTEFVAVLKEMVPLQADALEASLAKYKSGNLKAEVRRIKNHDRIGWPFGAPFSCAMQL